MNRALGAFSLAAPRRRAGVRLRAPQPPSPLRSRTGARLFKPAERRDFLRARTFSRSSVTLKTAAGPRAPAGSRKDMIRATGIIPDGLGAPKAPKKHASRLGQIFQSMFLFAQGMLKCSGATRFCKSDCCIERWRNQDGGWRVAATSTLDWLLARRLVVSLIQRKNGFSLNRAEGVTSSAMASGSCSALRQGNPPQCIEAIPPVARIKTSVGTGRHIDCALIGNDGASRR